MGMSGHSPAALAPLGSGSGVPGRRRGTRILADHAEAIFDVDNYVEVALGQRHISQCAEDEIKALNRHLEHRLDELAEVNRELEAFSYSVSHDLRGPLSRIAGFSQGSGDCGQRGGVRAFIADGDI